MTGKSELSHLMGDRPAQIYPFVVVTVAALEIDCRMSVINRFNMT